MFVNANYFAAKPGMRTGERTFPLTFLVILTTRAVYEYLRTPVPQRPKLFSLFTILLILFWLYYMTHVAVIYLFHYDEVPVDSIAAVFGVYRPGLFRFFDYHMLWIGLFPTMVLHRDMARAKRVLVILGIVMSFGILSILWEYFAPLPLFLKILFQLKAAGETTEGYRVRDPAPLYMLMAGFVFAPLAVRLQRGLRNVLALLFITAATFAILITKNRILWAGILAFLPIALLWKPPQVLFKQAIVLGITILVALTGLFHPRVNETVTRVVNEVIERWSRNHAYGGDPRMDPSYQGRVREREAWEYQMRTWPLTQRLFGGGLEAGYGRYISLYDAGYQNPRFRTLYTEKVHMHFAWLGRIYRIGWVGTLLLAATILAFFIRAIQIFYSTKEPFVRGLIIGVCGAMVGVLAFDSLHSLLNRSEALPVILMGAFVEIIPHWQRTGQLAPSTIEQQTSSEALSTA